MIIDVYHDTVCPWCRIGKAHLRKALADWDGEPISVRYRTFFLNQDIPDEGHDFAEYMNAKGGGKVPLEEWFARPREMGTQAGLEFNFEKITRAPNSTRSHELIAFAPEEYKEQVIDALYDAYFRDGRDIGSTEELLSIAEEAGLDPSGAREALESRSFREAVLAEYDEARRGLAAAGRRRLWG
jgi:predicted DsbA family dithiol-disulfide isomerase